MVTHIEQVFSGLRGSGYQVTSPQNDTYNCIAWAAGDTTNWWWPDEPDNPHSSHWPPGVPRVETLESFRQAFATLGCQGQGRRMWRKADSISTRLPPVTPPSLLPGRRSGRIASRRAVPGE